MPLEIKLSLFVCLPLGGEGYLGQDISNDFVVSGRAASIVLTWASHPFPGEYVFS